MQIMSKEATKAIKRTPEGYTSITPWLISQSSEKLIKFLEGAFGAEEVPNSKIKNADGVVIHVVVKIGDAMLMLFDSRKGWAPSPGFLNLYVEDINETYGKVLKLGAASVTEITPLWFGEKVCRIIDPFGNLWWINQRIEDVDLTDIEEVTRRSSTPEATMGIAYIQRSLDEAMKRQKIFFENGPSVS
jgi:uncharacterized glyoxalase superfamily protein PhnB